MNMANWNWFDWVLIAILIASMVRAFITGLVRAIAGLFGFVAGFEVASWGYIDLGDRIRDVVRLTLLGECCLLLLFLRELIDERRHPGRIHQARQESGRLNEGVAQIRE